MFILPNERRITSRDFHQEVTETSWSEMKHLAKQAGICYNTFITRIRSGMKEKEAATTPLKQKDNMGVWVGDTFDTRRGHCKALGINYGTIAGYMSKHNVDFETAVNMRLNKLKSDKKET